MQQRERWKRTWGRLGNMPIKKQLYLTYLLAMVLPIVFVGIFLIGNTSNLLDSYHTDMMDLDNKRVKNILFEVTTQVHNMAENIAFHEPLLDILTPSYESVEDFRKAVGTVELLDSYKNTYMELNEIIVYTDNPTITKYKQFTPVTREIEDSDWYKRANQQAGIFWTAMKRVDEYGNEYWNACLVRRIPLVNSPYHAVLVMRLSDDYLRIGIDNSSYKTYVSIDQGKVCYSTDREHYGKEPILNINYNHPFYQYAGMVTMDAKICFAEVTTLNSYQSDSKFYIITINPEGYYENSHIIAVCYIILILAILIPGVLIHFFAEYFTGRVEVLRQEMHKASRRDYEITSVIHGNDELSEAFGDLQIMVGNIKEQEAKTYQTQIRQQELLNGQREMEFKRLASQINPHFLYNTLETIRMKAFTAGDREVATAIKLLGKSMRYVLENTGTSKTTLDKELEHVKVYLEIQKLRFADRFDSNIYVDPEIVPEEISVLPLILQPLVENSILHGLEEREAGGNIQVDVYPMERRHIGISVKDNGRGMSEEEVQALLDKIKTPHKETVKSIGLSNINERLKLLYGEEYGIEIQSAIDEGTTVTITIPIQ